MNQQVVVWRRGAAGAVAAACMVVAAVLLLQGAGGASDAGGVQRGHGPQVRSAFTPTHWVYLPTVAGGRWPAVTLVTRASGLESPTHVTHAGDGSGRLFVAEKAGTIRIVRGGTVEPEPFLYIADRVGSAGHEQGLLSLAFPPQYESKHYVYVDYTDVEGDTVVSRFHLTADADVADPGSEEVVFSYEQPHGNHNGGQLAFGPDGYLYVAMGDGGAQGDPQGYAQDPTSLLGKLLRLDVESGVLPYGIPTTNPYTATAGYREEIWALGLRNPWRFSFDRDTGDLYVGDVGQETYEEIDFQPATSAGGENYGWNVMEGPECYLSDTCDQSGLTLPVAAYEHGPHCSVTGGSVYRGSAIPALHGIYVYADYCSGSIWGLQRAREIWHGGLLLDTDLAISSFGEDEAGNVYAVALAGGTLHEVVGGP